MSYTVGQIKDELPVIHVLKNRTIVSGQLSGRLALFAIVTLPDGSRYEVAWSTLANLLNTNRALIV